MSFEDNDSIVDFQQPLKRVRFSDEADDVYEYEAEPNGNNENLSMENESNTVSTSELQNVEHTQESKKALHCDNVKGAANANSVPECCDDKVELIVCNKQDNITGDSSEVDCFVKSSEMSTNSLVSDSPPIEHFDKNSPLADLNSLIYKTEHMTISTSKQAEEVDHHMSSSEQVGASVPPDIYADDILHVIVHKIKQNDVPASLTQHKMKQDDVPTSLVKQDVVPVSLSQHKVKQDDVPASTTRKRSLEGTLIERQSTKLNSRFKTDVSALSSTALKSAAFDAWTEVKSESAKFETTPSVPEMKVVLPKPTQGKLEGKDAKVKIAKRKREREFKNARKITIVECEPEPEPISQKRKSDSEEGKMAFRAWKKKKDELLNQQIAEKRKKEEKKRLDALIYERMRKSDAESAYLAWISHKAATMQKEKKKLQWLLERENQKICEKVKRNDEAAKIYYKWLRSKIFSQGNECPIITEDKPPWTPPGKANSLI